MPERVLRGGLLLMGCLVCSGCAGASRDALIAAAEHRLEEARTRDRGSGGESAFEVYDAEEHLIDARAARDGRLGIGGTGDARDAYRSAEEAVVLPR
jgi:hypothetical protein